jgi:hypothetical protein
LDPDMVRNGGGVIEPGCPDDQESHERSGDDAGETKAVQGVIGLHNSALVKAPADEGKGFTGRLPKFAGVLIS